MDRSESVARAHLMFRGYPAPVFEPDGNVPPDFLVDGHIAVEVRRLNENERTSPVPRGLEETEIPLLVGLQRLADSFGPSTMRAWWLRFSFRRPAPSWRTIERSAHEFLLGVRDGPFAARRATHLDPNVELEAIAREGVGDEMFHVAIVSDEDSGGWVLEELERNLKLCIRQKEQKVERVRHKYPVWWLVLIDQLAYGLPAFDRAQFKANVSIQHGFDKVVLVNPVDHTHYFDL